MQLSFDDLPAIFLQAAAFFAIYYLLYKKYIYSIFDPVFFYAYTISFSSVLVITTLGETQPIYCAHFFLCNLFLYVGFAFTSNKLKNSGSQMLFTNITTSFPDYSTLKLIIYVLCVIYFLSNILVLATTGFGLLTDDPTAQRLENLEKGFAILSILNFALSGFVTAGLFFLILSKFKYIDLLLLSSVVFLSALDGKKSVLLRFMIILAMLAHHKLFKHNRKIVRSVKLLTPVGIVAILAVAFIVLFKESAGGSEEAMLRFVKRLLYGADSTLIFYLPVNEQYFARFHFWDYPSHLFNQILGLLRLATLEQSHGDAMARNVFTHDSGTISGPNTPYYIEGQIYFGYYGAFVYSAVVGACYAYIRHYFFNARFYTAFGFVMMCCINELAINLFIELTWTVTRMFEVLFFTLPVYVVINFTVHGRLKWRKLKYQ